MNRDMVLDELPQDIRDSVMSFYSECAKYTVLMLALSVAYFIFFMSTEHEATFSVFMIPLTLGIYFSQKKLTRRYIRRMSMDMAAYKVAAHAIVGAHGSNPIDNDNMERNYKMRYALSKAMSLISTSGINAINRFACWLMLGFYTSGVAIYLIERYL